MTLGHFQSYFIVKAAATLTSSPGFLNWGLQNPIRMDGVYKLSVTCFNITCPQSDIFLLFLVRSIPVSLHMKCYSFTPSSQPVFPEEHVSIIHRATVIWPITPVKFSNYSSKIKITMENRNHMVSVMGKIKMIFRFILFTQNFYMYLLFPVTIFVYLDYQPDLLLTRWQPMKKIQEVTRLLAIHIPNIWICPN